MLAGFRHNLSAHPVEVWHFLQLFLKLMKSIFTSQSRLFHNLQVWLLVIWLSTCNELHATRFVHTDISNLWHLNMGNNNLVRACFLYKFIGDYLNIIRTKLAIGCMTRSGMNGGGKLVERDLLTSYPDLQGAAQTWKSKRQFLDDSLYKCWGL